MGKKKSKKKLFIILGILFVLIIITTIYVVSTSGEVPIKVSIEKAGKRTITQIVSAIGKIEPETEVKVSSQTSGEIIFLGVKEGDQVKSNQMLVRINPDIIETQLEQSKAAADAMKIDIEARKSEKERAELDFNRMNDLFKKDFVSKQQFDQAKSMFDQAVAGYQAALSRYEQAMASLKQVQRNAIRANIYTPISGIVTKLNVEKGEKVVGTELMQGTEMMKIANLEVMNCVVDVDENEIVLVKIGDSATVEIDAFPDRIFTGVVYEIGHSAKVNQLGSQDQVTNFEVKVRLIGIETRLRPGMSCSVDIKTKTVENALSVPLQSVTIRESKNDKEEKKSDEDIEKTTAKDKSANSGKIEKPPTVVFVKNGSKAKMVKVETGISDKGYIEITKGLKEGEEVISGSFMAVSKELRDGSKIKTDSVTKNKVKFK
ncbi:MAG: Efflux transporter periplasmic adaptor subunit [Bacteroidota bacterium]|nr:Efflux transporter periplasmic adaptor subunit [Bacteroidota bacterium]